MIQTNSMNIGALTPGIVSIHHPRSSSLEIRQQVVSVSNVPNTIESSATRSHTPPLLLDRTEPQLRSNSQLSVITTQPRLNSSETIDLQSASINGSQVPDLSISLDKKTFKEHILPGVFKLINGVSCDYTSNTRSMINRLVSTENPLNLSEDIKNRLGDIKKQITTAQNNNDIKAIVRLTKEAEDCLSNVCVNFTSTDRKILALALQGIKIRQPLLMGQPLYFTIPAFGSAGSVKIGFHVNLVTPSVFDNYWSTEPNNEAHLQIFLHNELGGAINCFDFGNGFGLSGYGGLISHDGIDITIYKKGEGWQCSDPQLLNEYVVRAELNIPWNSTGTKGTGNCQYTFGSDYVSQRFFPWDSSGIKKCMAHVAPKWLAGIAATAGMAIKFGGANPLTVGAGAAAFHGTNMVTKYASENVSWMKPDKEFRIVELGTTSMPFDGGYTDSLGFGARGMVRLNAGVGTLLNNVSLTDVNEAPRQRVTSEPLPTKQDMTPPRSPNEMELRQRHVKNDDNV